MTCEGVLPRELLSEEVMDVWRRPMLCGRVRFRVAFRLMGESLGRKVGPLAYTEVAVLLLVDTEGSVVALEEVLEWFC